MTPLAATARWRDLLGLLAHVNRHRVHRPDVTDPARREVEQAGRTGGHGAAAVIVADHHADVAVGDARPIVVGGDQQRPSDVERVTGRSAIQCSSCRFQCRTPYRRSRCAQSSRCRSMATTASAASPTSAAERTAGGRTISPSTLTQRPHLPVSGDSLRGSGRRHPFCGSGSACQASGPTSLRPTKTRGSSSRTRQ